MTSSMTGRNGLPDALGNRSEPQVAVATTPAPISTATATLAATAHASDADSRDSKGATSAPPSASLSANAPSSTAAGPVAESSSSSSATSAAPPPPPPTAAAPSAPTSTPAPAPAVPSTTSPTEPSTASIPRPSTPNRETSTSASATAPASPPRPSTPPSRSALNTLATSALNADAALGTRPQGAASSAQASAPVDASSNDHPMPDAPAPVDASAPSNSAVELQQTTPMQMDLPANNMAEPFAPSTPYNQVTLPTLNQHAYMMMALASMAAPPTTITPSQVTLPNPMDEAFNGLAPANSIRQANADKTLESFARIEFADSVFQMTTYAVIIGRDQRALEQARRDEKRDEAYRRRVEQHAENGLPPPSPPRGPDRSKFSKSYVSEEGGMLGPESDNGESGRPAKRRKTSTQGSSQHDNDEAAAQAQENMISNRQYVSHTPGAAAVDLTSLRPSPWHVPFIGIHSPGPNIASKTKAISREHLKIAYNEKEGVFEAIPLHKNGFFCEDVHYKSEKVVLKCGDRLQIKDIDFRFLINGVERGRTGAEEDVEEETAVQKRHAHGGKEMSFDFESSHVNGQVQDTSDELSEVASPPELSDFGEEEEAEAEAEEAEEAEPMETVEAELEPEPKQEPEPERPAPVQEPFVKPESVPEPELQPHGLMPQIPKKRGPGRPPKNGIMSKREQRLLKKQQQEMAKKTLPQAPPVEPPIKRKVGRPRKHPLPDDASERPEKRKYKPRKPKEDGAEGSDAERRAREKKEKKARPKSPPLNLNVNDYTKEELQKPNKNYGVLIDETLTAAGPDGLTLKQIYKRICERYPYFFFRTETKGWESSVRHNLIGNEAFRKDETTNLWSRVPGVELDAGKKRKASSPDRNNLAASQAYNQQYSYQYNAAQHVAPGAPGYPPGQAPPAYQMPAYNAQQGQAQASQAPRPVQPYAASASPPAPGQPTPGQPAAGQPAQTAPTQPPAPAQLPAGYGPPPAPARPQLGGPQPGAYSSPYAPRPPPPANPPVKSEDGHPAPAAPTATASAQPPPPLAAAKTVPGPAPASQPVAAAAAAAQTSRPPAAAPATTTPARPVIDPRLLAAVVNLKNGLVLNLNRARNPRSEGIVMSALNRCLGLKKQATENDKMESICMKGIRQVMEGFTKNSPTPGPAASASPPASDLPPVLEPRVLASLTGFKDVSVKALRAKLGEAKAEAVTLSAIDRVLGFADASIVPPPGEGETVGNFEGVEQHLMKSIRQLLEGMNQTVQGS
ncbi:hypothetical protein CEP54_001587 [Fusarium duplospermum]|uniref:Fork-head domain-containing protein n=1 Tax=Fusarium duplospermum TaxID=1325734 RepID=A0A428R090_9HYPO|nr:hypothetical protein CEP54_001587 [Fusarium duplospermum]